MSKTQPRPKVVIDSAIRVTPRLSALPIELVPIAGGDVSAASLGNADALLTRTVTRVDATLLASAHLRFVGTASSGVDHIDTHYLKYRNIHFADAKGCNAAAVGDYVLAAIASCHRLPALLAGEIVGLVGYGHVGHALAARLVALGARVMVYDPFVHNVTAGVEHVCLEDALGCPIVSLHASLHGDYPHPSQNLIDSTRVGCIRDDALFINAGRGGLVTTGALLDLASRGVTLVIDTWPGEPKISAELVSKVALATPHIAGYSTNAKINATDYLIDSLVSALGISESEVRADVTDEVPMVLDVSGLSRVDTPARGDTLAQIDALTKLNALDKAISAVSCIVEDDAHFRRVWQSAPVSQTFESLREHYRLRHQISDLRVTLSEPRPDLVQILTAAGVGHVH